MRSVSAIQKDLAKLRTKEAALEKELGQAFKRKTVQCTMNFFFGDGCGKRTAIGNLEFIQTHYYVPPRGCTEGDYWRKSEGQFDCPKCGHRNRLYDRPEIEKLKDHFKKVVDIYDK